MLKAYKIIRNLFDTACDFKGCSAQCVCACVCVCVCVKERGAEAVGEEPVSPGTNTELCAS